MRWTIITHWCWRINPNHSLRLRITLCSVSELIKGVYWQAILVGIWVLDSCSSAFRALKKVLFCLGASTIYRVWWAMFLVLFEERMREILSLEDGNKPTFFWSFLRKKINSVHTTSCVALFNSFCPRLIKTTFFWPHNKPFIEVEKGSTLAGMTSWGIGFGL